MLINLASHVLITKRRQNLFRWRMTYSCTFEAVKPWQRTTTLFDPVWCRIPTRFSPCLFATSTLCPGAAVQKPNHTWIQQFGGRMKSYPAAISTAKYYWQSQFTTSGSNKRSGKGGAHGDWAHLGMSWAAPPWLAAAVTVRPRLGSDRRRPVLPTPPAAGSAGESRAGEWSEWERPRGIREGLPS